jgi:hypothetical protein
MDHGPDARDAALANDLVVEPDSSNLCTEYEAAHFDPTSNILHSEGMIASVLLFGTALLFQRWILLACIPPTFYIPAWIGHFIFQKDIPAVFSYGTTLTGWASGEYCSLSSLFAGRSVTRTMDLIPSTFLAISVVYALVVSSNDDCMPDEPEERRSKTSKVKHS